jgi:acetyl esterase/lipase
MNVAGTLMRAGAMLLASLSIADAQVSMMPKVVQDRLQQVGPGWGKDISGNIEKTLQVYAPVLAAAPKAGVTVTRDIAYGGDVRQRLDLYRPQTGANTPVVVFFHGGAYTRGERNVTADVYANIPTWFARNGILGINADYRLAPVVKWPAAAQDVGAVVKWVKQNAAAYGGDPNRIYLIGHSAGATHVASYVFIDGLHPPEGPGVAGMVLISGRYDFRPNPDDPNLANFQAYFGSDTSQYATRSPINYIKSAPRLPTFIAIAEYDNPDLDTQGALLFAAICQRDRSCPRFTRLEKHNHLSETYQFNTPDEAFAREVLAFIGRNR